MAPTGIFVFDIPEILELILLNVPQIDIFILQRVSRTFNNTISGSKLLQAKVKEAVPLDKHSSTFDFISMAFSVPQTGTYVSTVLRYSSFLELPPFRVERTGVGCTRPGVPTMLFDFTSNNDLASLNDRVLGWRGKSGKIYRSGSWEKLALGTSVGRVDVHGKEYGEVGARYIGGGVSRNTSGGYNTIASGGTLGDVFEAVEEVRRKIDGEKRRM